MRTLTARVLVVASALVIFMGSAHAARVAVWNGTGTNCQPTLPYYPTIQQAVNDVPSDSTILVCPGTYPEQVTIAKALTLKGVSLGMSDSAIIVVPKTGLVANATCSDCEDIVGQPAAAQVLVNGTGGVTISDLTVDGTGANYPAPNDVGIEFLNAASGTVEHVAVRYIGNCVVSVASGGFCQSSVGILSENSSVKIESSVVHDTNAGVIADGGVNTITSMTILNTPVNGIFFDGTYFLANQGAITSNSAFSGAFNGIALINATNIAVTGNRIGGITGRGIDLSGSTGGCTVQSNEIADTGEGVLDGSSGGANIITNNVINEAVNGIVFQAGNTDTLGPNTFHNVQVTAVDPTAIQVQSAGASILPE